MASYSLSDKHKAMTVLSTVSGNAGLASKELKEHHALGVVPATLRRWRTGEMREFYEQLLEDLGDVSAALINETLETARLAAMAERLAIERTHADLAAGTCKDPAKAARDLSHIKAMNVEKYLTLTGRPTQIVEVTSPDQAFKELADMGVITSVGAGADIEGEAFEIPEELAALLSGGASSAT